MRTRFLTLVRRSLLYFFCSVGLTGVVCAGTDSPQKPIPVPFVNQPLVPDAIAPGGGDFTLVVNGTGFTRGSVVKWNEQTRATTFMSPEQLTAVITAADIAAPSTGSVKVVTNGAGSRTSNVVYLPVTFPTSSVFFTRSDIAGIDRKSGLVAGDFNEDGIVDLATPSAGFASPPYLVYVLLGSVDGTFQPVMTYPDGVTNGSAAILSGDFNEDGHLDLVTGGRGFIYILLGNGDGSFGPFAEFGVIPAEYGGALQTCDLNGDGHLDVLVADGLAATFSIFFGNGDGTFQPAIAHPAGPYARSIAVGDYDGNGVMDLAVFSTDYMTKPHSRVGILLGKGDGSFRQKYSYGTEDTGEDIVAADFNGDGILDLATASPSQGIISIALGNGDGTFKPVLDIPTDPGPFRLATGDLNGDGRLDLAVYCVGHGTNTRVSTLLGNGDGTFQPFTTNPISFGGGEGFVMADFNQDGRLDIAASCHLNISILTQNLRALDPSKRR